MVSRARNACKQDGRTSFEWVEAERGEGRGVEREMVDLVERAVPTRRDDMRLAKGSCGIN